ncbi:FAD-dependent oxidoreductase [Mycobacterium montefiorense]|uniref:FAD-dependent oxidoreductase n=1 Tax=Mycobacterium montefiorense TaxID=154654 RepID=UPI001F486A41|nr:2-polyprenyl-6-methoxyphenol hydroxylase-like oxidoreductase [Mycobacterium montefiorense]
MGETRQRAIVLGASMGGLLAARALADFYHTVTVVERDRLPEGPVNRRGVPQGKHPHALLGKAVEILGHRFPGLFDQLVADGAIRWDDGDLSRFWWMIGGRLMARSSTLPDPAAMTNYHLSRPLLEWGVRRAVRAIPNVKILEQHDFVSLGTDPERLRITDVWVSKRDNDTAMRLPADLVVDATGRGSRTPMFLEQFGYDRPRSDSVDVRLAYSTLPVRIPHGMLTEVMVANPPTPSRPSLFAMIGCEQDTYFVCVGFLGGQDPPVAREAFLDLVAEVAPPHVTAAVRAGEPLAEVAQHRVPSNRWLRYDKLARMPEGLLVFGDAVCSFNPIYGQGMTIAAIEAEVLRDCLRRDNNIRHVQKRFHRRSAKSIRTAWGTAVRSDLALPYVPGRQSLSARMTTPYMNCILAAIETDPAVAQQLLRVLWMIDSPASLFRPAIVGRAARALVAGGRRRVPRRDDVGCCSIGLPFRRPRG